MVTQPPANPQPTIRRLIDDHGEWLGEIKCEVCAHKTLFRIRFDAGPKDVFVVCDRCDVSKDAIQR